MKMNPDFYGSDEIVVPKNVKELTGWTDGTIDEKDALEFEDRAGDAFEQDMPFACQVRDPKPANETMLKKWDEFQQSKGRQPGSNDMTLLSEFVTGGLLLWLAQIIGSCVWSNTFRRLVERYMFEAVILGQSQEYLGRDEFGPKNWAPYGPWSYGMARKRANMRGGDGLYCAPMAESLAKDGVLPCDTPALIELLKRLGRAGDKDFPEPQSASLYRAFGRWQYIDDLKQYAKYPVKETPAVTSAEQLWDLLGPDQGKPSFVCSGEAIHKVGEHPDGFAIHKRNPRDSWPHNMGFAGRFVASDGLRIVRQCNRSWGRRHIYNRPLEDIDKSFKARRLRVRAIGETDAPSSSVPMSGV